MRPLELTIEGLRSFRAPVTIDLRGRDQIAIVGDTGAGKSSIIEAITYALYGQATFSGLNRELMNDAASQLRVVLRFRSADEEWEVARTLRRRASGAIGAQSAQLRRFAADGTLLEMVEQARPVNERIEQVVGLNRDAFLRTTVLPQGRFAQLLVEDDPRDRSTILRQVWRTDELEEAGRIAAAAHGELATLRARLDQAAAAYPEDPRTHLKQLHQQAQQAEHAAAGAEETEQAAAGALQTVTAAVEQGRRAHAATERLGAFQAAALAATVAPLAATAEQINQQESTLCARQAALAEELAAIPVDDDGPAAAEVTGALTTLAGIPALARDATEAYGQARERRTAAQQARSAAAQADQAARQAQAQLVTGQARERELEQERQAAEQQREQLGERYDAAQQAAQVVQTAQGELTRRELLRGAAAERLQASDAESRRLSQAEARAREHREAAQRSRSAAVAAAPLHPGDECPICRALLAPDWQRPVSLDLDQATAAARAAEHAASEAHAARTEHATRTQLAERAVADATEQLQGRLEAAAKARAELRQRLATWLATPAASAARSAAGTVEPPLGAADTLAMLADRDPAGTPAAPLPPATRLLATVEAHAATAARAVDEHSRTLAFLHHAAAQREQEARTMAQTAAGADAHQAAAEQAEAGADARLRQAVASIPEPYRPALPSGAGHADLDPVAVEHCVAAAQRRERVLAGRAHDRARLGQASRAVAQETAALAQRRVTEVEQPLGATLRALNRQRDLLARSAGDFAGEVDLPDALAAPDPRAVAAHITLLTSITNQLVKGAAEGAARAAADRRNAEATLTEIARRIGSPVDGHAAVVNSARAAAESARYAARTARTAAAAFAAKVDHVAALRELLGEVEDRERALADLAAALKEGAFLKWLTLRRSRNLLVHASRTLEQISNGRYAFVEPADETHRWQVLDRDSGQPRSPASLSGGEQFIASLALAMGMVEMMARSGGRLEALFLDEGFGSLDRSNLDAAIEALGQVAASGRMVVLISHVQAVAEQVPDVAAVTRTAAGSRVEWLTDAQRRRLGETDAGSSALSGLLD
ncbi:MAG: SMC family ATPase [Spirochaetaceae bacterium]|nr:SMC family ATPase [Spirochaetaceae bacterium]